MSFKIYLVLLLTAVVRMNLHHVMTNNLVKKTTNKMNCWLCSMLLESSDRKLTVIHDIVHK